MKAHQIAEREKVCFHVNWKPTDCMFKDFTKFFPSKWFDNVFVKSTSNILQLAGEQPTSLAEMYCYVGLKLLIATVVGFSKCQFFSNKEYDEIHNFCPFKLNDYMVTQ